MKGLDLLGAFNLKSLNTTITSPHPPVRPTVAVTPIVPPKKPPLNVAITPPTKPTANTTIDAATKQKAINAAMKISSSTSRLRGAAQKNKKLRGKLTAIAKTLDSNAAKVQQAAQMSGGSSM